jgi:tetratricopeptide (TPR) repeat protein
MAFDVVNPILNALARGDYALGLEVFRALETPTPEDRLWAGQCLTFLSKGLLAIEQFVIAEREGLEEPKVMLAMLQRERGDLVQARQTLALVNVSKLEPVGMATFELERARLGVADGRWREAAAYAEAAVRVALPDPVAVMFIGNYAACAADLCSRIGQAVKVEELIEFALPQASERQRGWLILTRAVARMHLGRFAEAEEDLRSLGAPIRSPIEKDSGGGDLEVAASTSTLDSRVAAIPVAESVAISSESDSVDPATVSPTPVPTTQVPLLQATVAYYTAHLYRMRGPVDEATTLLLEAAQIARDHGKKEVECYAHLSLVWMAAATDNFSFARAHLARAQTLAEGLTLHAELALANGLLLARLNDATALELLERALEGFEASENERDAGIAHLHLAEALLRLDRTQEAKVHLERCVDARYALGCAATFAAELRALPAVFEHLTSQPQEPGTRGQSSRDQLSQNQPSRDQQARGHQTRDHGQRYATILLEDWRALEQYAPAQVSLVTLGGYKLLVDGQPVRLESGIARTCELISFMLEFGPAKLDDLQLGVFPDELGKLSREYIHKIRQSVNKAIPRLFLSFDKETRIYTVRTEGVRLQWDVRGLRDALSIGGETGLRRALALFTGSFMPRSEQEWVYDLRLELEHQIAMLGLSVLQDLEKREAFEACIELALRLIEVSPVQVEVGLLLVRSIMATQGQGAARETHAMLCQRFVAKIGEVPEEFLKMQGWQNSLN